MATTKSHTIREFYKSYCEYVKDNPLYQVDYKVFRSILTEYFKHIRDEVIEEGKEIKFPCRLGSFCIVKHKPKNFNSSSLRIDFHATKEAGKIIYHINEHSDYYKYRYFWSKYSCNVPNKSKYQLIATRENKRRLAQIIKNNERDYIER